jgi:ATP/maltotriose-dependent transcriptional regulator MalT
VFSLRHVHYPERRSPTVRDTVVSLEYARPSPNRQIATELFVGVGTVKTHVNNLYRKLDSHSRTQAVARARELKLL